MRKRLRFWEWDFFNFGKAGIVMTVWGFFWLNIFIEIMQLTVWMTYLIMIPMTWVFKYKVYEKLWANKRR